MTATINEGTVIPALLAEMSKKIVNPTQTDNGRNKEYLSYVAGWIQGAAEGEYKALLQRDGIPQDPRVVNLLCELAVMRALVRWHEVRDRPPPMPSIDAL